MKMESKYKSNNAFEKRRQDYLRVSEKYPERVPVIIEKKEFSNVPDIDKCKYLVPNEHTIGQLIAIIRRRINIKPNEAIFIFINNTLPCISDTVREVYERYKDNDGFLYIIYSGENTFG